MAQALGRLLGRANKYTLAQARFHEQPSSSVVRIRNLKSSRDEGILYPDDKLNDVADDREQIIADFEEEYTTLPHYHCGDGTSTSSVCTGSPDLFSVEVSSHGSVPYAHSDVEITEESPLSGITPLQVRRGSEPALNNLCPASPTTDPSKRWSTAVVINPGSPEKQNNSNEEIKTLPSETLVMNGDSKPPSRNFSRSSGRLSILGNNPETYRWVEAADRHLMTELNNKLSIKPLVNNCLERDAASDSSSASEERERTVILKNESGPLGIHVVPDYDNTGRDTGLMIQGIEAGGRIDRDGRFCVGDRIVEINGQSLRNVSFQAAQDVFKNALKTPQIKLELVRGGVVTNSKTAAVPRKPPPPVYPKPINSEEPKKAEEESTLVEGEERVGGVITKVATVTPTKKMPAATGHRLTTANTRKIGKKLAVQLTKGESGLGFSITTRDNPAGGSSPIYIKNVLSKGAAIEDGRLLPGDRLLEVNGIEMTGKTQAEAVKILRNTPLGGIVDMIVSRQEIDSSASDPETVTQTFLKPEEEAVIFPWKHRDILTFQIPLHDTGSAGLGVSVKGKSTTNGTSMGPVDLGIFIKSIIPGGAASKDGRLQSNDQLVNINGISLLGISNSNAMETLRKAMTQMDGPIPNAIILTIARRITQPSEEEPKSSTNSQAAKSSENTSSDSSNPSSEKEELKKETPRYTEVNGSAQPVMNSSNHQPNKELTNGPKSDTYPPGCNPVIERLTGQHTNGHYKKLPNEAYIFTNHNNIQQKLASLNEDKNRAPFSPTISVPSCESVLIEDEYSPVINKQKLSGSSENMLQNSQQNSVADLGTVASSQLSLEEAAGFARDGFGRQSMSEKRHAQLDAKNTDTYQRSKKAREERDRHRQAFEQEYMLENERTMESSQSQSSGLLQVPGAANDNEPRGPSLGLRKSSSLESLQTMIQELNKDDEAMKKALQSNNARTSRSRGCNESFRAAVDRSYEAPTPTTMETMETLDEESESGSSVGHILSRAAEITESSHSEITRDPLSDDILNLYCRSSKSSKKKGLLKGLGSVFKFGKNRKTELRGKFGEEIIQNPEPPILVPAMPNKEADRLSDKDQQRAFDIQKKPLPSIPRDNSSTSSLELVQNRQERMQNLREQHQRLHQKRHGHYPLDQKEELYESEIQEKEGKLIPSGAISHIRSHSHDEVEDRVKGRSATNEASRYSHYMNYKEIQQHMNQYYHHDQAPQFRKQHSGTIIPSKSAHPERPSSNYFEYESIQNLHRYTTSNHVNEMDSSSLPRGSHTGEHGVQHLRAQTNKHFYSGHESGSGYDRRNVHHHYYPNSALYPHVVPGSKV